MKLLVDYHHADLAESHQLVFADRFSWDVVFPYGMAWFDEWYWSFERGWYGDAVARQYLLGIWEGAEPDANGIVEVADTRHPGRTLTGITLEAAKDIRWDIAMSSVPANAPGFQKIANETGARFFIHVGNQWGDEAWSRNPDGAILTTTSVIPDGIPHVVVHQEFRLDDFRYEQPSGFGPVRSFVNGFPETPEYANFLETARKAPDITWEVYGAIGTGTPDEFTKRELHGTPLIGEAMRGASAIWHAKHWSDGFGHVIHNAFAVGRPVFGYARYYADKLAGPLWVEGETSFDVERKASQETFGIIRRLREDPEYHATLCENAARRFREVVSFDEDADKIAELVGIAVPA